MLLLIELIRSEMRIIHFFLKFNLYFDNHMHEIFCMRFSEKSDNLHFLMENLMQKISWIWLSRSDPSHFWCYLIDSMFSLPPRLYGGGGVHVCPHHTHPELDKIFNSNFWQKFFSYRLELFAHHHQQISNKMFFVMAVVVYMCVHHHHGLEKIFN